MELPSGPGTWNGVFYPKPRPRGFDELRFYAERFNTVEINSTFYGQPRCEIARTWAERTPSDFDFALKLYQKFTHPKMFKEYSANELEEFADTVKAVKEIVKGDVRTHFNNHYSAKAITNARSLQKMLGVETRTEAGVGARRVEPLKVRRPRK